MAFQWLTIQYLPAPRDIPLPGKMFVEELEKLIHLSRLRQRLTIQPHGFRVRNPVPKPQPEETPSCLTNNPALM